MNCPQCEAAKLRDILRGDVIMKVCQYCRGVWLDQDDLEKLVADMRKEFQRNISQGRLDGMRSPGTSGPVIDEEGHCTTRIHHWIKIFEELLK